MIKKILQLLISFRQHLLIDSKIDMNEKIYMKYVEFYWKRYTDLEGIIIYLKTQIEANHIEGNFHS